MSTLSPLGIIHTLISLVAVGAAVAAFLRDGRIDPGNGTGRLYVAVTVLSCVSGLFIFAHGGFGKPHMLALITLGTLALAGLVRWARMFGRAAQAVETVLYSLTFFFHMVPGVTETTTRLPVGAPLVASPEAPALAAAYGVMFCLFILGSIWQVRALRASRPSPFGERRPTV
jgi:uncharacterized membrane protein